MLLLLLLSMVIQSRLLPQVLLLPVPSLEPLLSALLTLTLLVVVLLWPAPLWLACWQLPVMWLLLCSVVMALLVDVYQLMLLLLHLPTRVWRSLKAR